MKVISLAKRRWKHRLSAHVVSVEQSMAVLGLLAVGLLNLLLHLVLNRIQFCRALLTLPYKSVQIQRCTQVKRLKQQGLLRQHCQVYLRLMKLKVLQNWLEELQVWGRQTVQPLKRQSSVNGFCLTTERSVWFAVLSKFQATPRKQSKKKLCLCWKTSTA